MKTFGANTYRHLEEIENKFFGEDPPEENQPTMKNTTNFKQFKEEFAKRAKENGACTEEYKKLLQAKNFKEVFQVMKDNFLWCCRNKTIDVEFLTEVKKEANKNDVFVNESVIRGFLLVSNATVRAGGNATVRAGGNTTVEAWGNATVEAWDNATVRAWGNATVEAWDNATVRAGGNTTVEAWDNATVEAWDNAYVNTRSDMECKITDRAIIRYRDTNEVVICKGMLTLKEI